MRGPRRWGSIAGEDKYLDDFLQFLWEIIHAIDSHGELSLRMRWLHSARPEPVGGFRTWPSLKREGVLMGNEFYFVIPMYAFSFYSLS
jgi:hypothetical protein